MKGKPGIQSAQVLALTEAQGHLAAAAALLWGDLQHSPPDRRDWGSSCQLKMLLPLLASVMSVRMRWELVGAGASPRNRTSPRTTTEPFLGGTERGQWAEHILLFFSFPSAFTQKFRQGSLRVMTAGREHSPSQ